MKKLKYLVFMIPILFGFINTVNADIISSDTVTTYFITNSSGSSIAELFTTGTNTFTMPSNSRISRWIVQFDKTSFNLIPNQKYTFYLYFYINNKDYGWVENASDVKFTVDDITGTNYVSSTTGAYNSSTNYIVIEFDIIAPDLSNSSVAYITLDNTSSNKYALAYSTGSSSVVVGFSKLSYFLAEGSSGDQTIIDQNQTIIDQNNQTNEALGDLNDNITSEEMPETPDFSDIELADDTPISDLILMPINYINKLISAFSNECRTYTLDFGILGADYVLSFPCIRVEDWIGTNAWNIVDLLICFFMCYEIGMLAVMIFNDFTSMKDTYDSLYQPKHSGYQPKHGGDE